MPTAIFMPGSFMPVGIACARYSFACRHADAGRHSYAWCAHAGHHRILFVQNGAGMAIDALVTPARLSKMQADFTTQLTNKLARLLNNLNGLWAFWVAPSNRDDRDEGDLEKSRWPGR